MGAVTEVPGVGLDRSVDVVGSGTAERAREPGAVRRPCGLRRLVGRCCSGLYAESQALLLPGDAGRRDRARTEGNRRGPGPRDVMQGAVVGGREVQERLSAACWVGREEHPVDARVVDPAAAGLGAEALRTDHAVLRREVPVPELVAGL